MEILLTNDDGIYAPGLAALERQLRKMGVVTVVAPLTEQSGVSHSITYLTPLMAREVFDDTGNRRGWAVEGSPADCVKLAVAELCPVRPELVVSGINGGLNAGINVLYSGTVAAAIEGAFFGITSVAVSLEYDDAARFDLAAEQAAAVIRQILCQKDSAHHLYNLNIPSRALDDQAEVHIVPMATAPWGEDFEERKDPRGRRYFWATGLAPDPPTHTETDLSAIRAGHITLTPLQFNMTHHEQLQHMKQWQLGPAPATR
ncbi:MAG: 5'/3'-nucleotidase SurE [Pirellulales bacterium]|nr:5'/3'-nucleotidase SurE [Pirellulales bacterium]